MPANISILPPYTVSNRLCYVSITDNNKFMGVAVMGINYSQPI
ncbi:MAG: hypothetical protein ACI95X_002818 [Paraglaciecola sp.]|jgi:hypothetical protein